MTSLKYLFIFLLSTSTVASFANDYRNNVLDLIQTGGSSGSNTDYNSNYGYGYGYGDGGDLGYQGPYDPKKPIDPITKKRRELENTRKVIGMTRELVALGTQVWDLLERGKPIVSYNFIPIAVLPRLKGEQEADAFYNMYGWSEPQYAKYRIHFKSTLGFTIVDLKLKVTYQYGGLLDGTIGRYLKGINIIIEDSVVKPLFDVNAQARLIGITNVSQKKDEVLAAAHFEVSVQVTHKVGLGHESKGVGIFINGDGKITFSN